MHVIYCASDVLDPSSCTSSLSTCHCLTYVALGMTPRIGESNVLHTGHHACLRVGLDHALSGAIVPEGQASFNLCAFNLCEASISAMLQSAVQAHKRGDGSAE
jgi:hypothetical protein